MVFKLINWLKLLFLSSTSFLDLNYSFMNFFSAAFSKCCVLFLRMLMAGCQWRNFVRAPSLIHQLCRHCHCMTDWSKVFIPEPCPLVISHVNLFMQMHFTHQACGLGSPGWQTMTIYVFLNINCLFMWCIKCTEYVHRHSFGGTYPQAHVLI